MAFPATLDDLSATRAAAGTDKLSTPDHLVHHAAEDTALEALEDKVGIDDSAVVTSLDYLLKNAASINPGHLHNVLAALDGDPANAVYVDNDGYVGIGTAVPAAQLDVLSAASHYSGFVTAIFQDSSNRATLRIRSLTDNPAEFLFDVNEAVRWSFSTRASGDAYSLRLYGQGVVPSYTDLQGPYLQITQTGIVSIGTTLSLAKLHVDQAVSGAAIPVLTLDQADVSDGFINFIGSDRGVIAAATASLVSVRVELAGTVYRLALYVDA